jgi:uncharacterized protein
MWRKSTNEKLIISTTLAQCEEKMILEKTRQLRDLIQNSQFSAQMNPSIHVVHLFEGGSALYGTGLEGKTDTDVCGVFIEPLINIYGLDSFEHFVTSTSDQTERNTADDVDICLYSLRRWAFLATKGNPTALSYLFADSHAAMHWVWDYAVLGELKKAILAKSAATHFKGFIQGQMSRLLNEKGQGKHGQRPELVENFGYDVKAASHAVRLATECIELMTVGFIRYPRPDADLLKTIKRGEWSLDRLCGYVSQLLTDLDLAVEYSRLPAKPDRVKVSTALVDAYTTFYQECV